MSWLYPDEESSFWDDSFDSFEKSKIKCECGAEKIKDPHHSDWCPKYEDSKKPKKDKYD